MKVSPKGVGIVGREFAVTVRGLSEESGVRERRLGLAAPAQGEPAVIVASCPEFVEFLTAGGGAGAEGAGAEDEIALRFRALRPGRGLVRLKLAAAGWESAETGEFAVPVVVFREKEYFLCLVISSNYHYGWDPLSYLFGNTPEELELEGDAYPKTRQLEAMYHRRGLPITWLIDRSVAEKARDSLLRWHETVGDDYGVMPTSFFHHNPVNYNLEKSAEEATALLKKEKNSVEALFPFWTDVAGIDQWVGSVGTNWVRAARALGLSGLWGVGFDHRTCDTSMFHRGVPFEAYKPDPENYRLPAGRAAASNLWVYQWTTRDIVNTVHTPDGGAGGSTLFSTDPDDIRVSGIMFRQRDYWNRLLAEYRNNLDNNDFGIFLVHQEDHDCHFPEDADYLRGFLDGVRPALESGDVTPATLEEVSQWLNLRYGPREHPRQVLELEDALADHGGVDFSWVVKPEDWPSAGGRYPAHVAFCDRDWMFFGQYPEATPFRAFDFAARHATAEDAVYQEEKLPKVAVAGARWVGGAGEPEGLRLELVVGSEKARDGCPVLVWNYPKPPAGVRLAGEGGAGANAADEGATGNAVLAATKRCLVVRLNLTKGRQVVQVTVS